MKTAARTAQRAAISRFLQLVGVPDPPEGPPCHDPRDIHRFQKLQDLPQRSASHDLLSLSAFQRFQKDPQATILEIFIVFFEIPRLSPEVPESRFIELVGAPERPEGPRSHDPRDMHRFSRVQDCPQRSPSHDLSALSTF